MNVTIRHETLRKDGTWVADSVLTHAYSYETSKRCIEDTETMHSVSGKMEREKRLEGHDEEFDTIVWTDSDGAQRTIITFHFNERHKECYQQQ